jgi:microcystin-dependent protein
MSQPYIGEIRCFGFQFAPANWASCNGQTLSIAQYTALYSVIGTTYGGNGQTTFALPNLQGSVPMHWGTGLSGLTTTIGQVLGTANMTLTTLQTPAHAHTLTVQQVPAGGVVERTPAPKSVSYLADSSPDDIYQTTSPTINAQFSPNVLTSVGGSQPHENRQPYLALNFCMSLAGVFPSRN